ncbi:hypothetical protein GT039_22690, partial [Streptomyces sp. SID2955]|nr:hypothetical protein [Streptomyces sp. SID2955]
MSRRSKILSGALITSALALTSFGVTGVAASSTPAAAAAPAHAGHAMALSTAASPEDPD